jgi:4-aminobutyrate aminotransferase-like enzyme
MKKLAELAKEWECMLISEEVTTGMGRTGYWFGFQREELAPDVLVLGKALGNGLPVAAVVTTTDAENAFAGKFTHTQSHQNDPFTGAIVSVVIDIIREERLVEKARDMGSYLLRGLDRIQYAHSRVGNARGLGLMTAVELEGPGAEQRGVRIQRNLMDQGVIVDFNRAVSSFRFFPPYVISKEQLDMALQALDSALQSPH